MKTPNKQTGTRHTRAIALTRRNFDRLKSPEERHLAGWSAARTAHTILRLRSGKEALEWTAGTQMEDIRPARPLITVGFDQAHNHHGPFTIHA